VARSNYNNWLPFLFTTLWWRMKHRKSWQVEVFRLGRVGPEYPPVVREHLDQEWLAETRGSSLAKDLVDGRIGWDRWHAPTRPVDAGNHPEN